jgi:hypothetical protein
MASSAFCRFLGVFHDQDLDRRHSWLQLKAELLGE